MGEGQENLFLSSKNCPGKLLTQAHKMDIATISSKVKELIVNQEHMLNAIKYLSEKVEDITNQLNCEKVNIRDILESKEIVVKNSNDILLIRKTREENDAAIKILDMRIDMIKQEIDIKRENVKKETDRLKKDSSVKKSLSPRKCNLCDENFDRYSDLEMHIKLTHEIHQMFKCDMCEKQFVLNWRLKKHMNMHSERISLHCHYFNNNKKCPFEVLGCKFMHKASTECKNGVSSKRPKCSF